MLKDNHVSASVLNSVDGVLEFGKGDTVAYMWSYKYWDETVIDNCEVIRLSATCK